MRKVIETGHEDALDEERIALYISTGRGNTAGLPEIHLRFVDPVSGDEVGAWLFKDELIAALLDPNPAPKVSPGVEEPA